MTDDERPNGKTVILVTHDLELMLPSTTELKMDHHGL